MAGDPASDHWPVCTLLETGSSLGTGTVTLTGTGQWAVAQRAAGSGGKEVERKSSQGVDPSDQTWDRCMEET